MQGHRLHRALFTGLLAITLCLSWAFSAFAADVIYNRAIREMMKGTINLSASTTSFKVALLTSSYTPSKAHTSFTSQLQAYEVSGTGYTAGGQYLTSGSGANPPLVTEDNGTNFNGAWWSGDNVSWTSATITARYAVVYQVSTGIPVVLKDFGSNISSTNATFTVQWATDANGGLMKITGP